MNLSITKLLAKIRAWMTGDKALKETNTDQPIAPLMTKLRAAVREGDFMAISYEVVEELVALPDAFAAIEPILRLMEDNPESDFGTPGPLVHFVEKFYLHGYEEQLLQSIARKPTKHTVWMLNRVINGSQGEVKNEFLSILADVAQAKDSDKQLVAFTKSLLVMHEENNHVGY